MSKRVDAIRTLFAQRALSADNAPERAPSGPVRSIRDTFSDVERENEALRAELTHATRVVELDPALIDPSPFADRFAHEDDAAYLALKTSVEERGQEVPILVRAHPRDPGRYQAAYGHRRLRAARELQRPVKAIVRNLGEDELVVAQGLENSAREDLSFIERALFAHSMEESGFDRATIQQALAVDRAEASKLIAVARAAPRDVVLAIGKAARTGRPRWQEFAESLKTPAALKRVHKAIADPAFREASSDERFLRASRAAGSAGAAREKPQALLRVNDASGALLASVRSGPRDIRVELARTDPPRFAAFLAERLPELLQAFDETQGAAD
jgi:ParB family chromosome partitioning protein